MIQEAYCSYEVSKLLKERGFDEYCRYFYDCETPTNSYLSNKGYGEYIHNSKVYDGRNLAACPTHQMAMAWLREVYNIFIIIEPYSNTSCYFSLWEGDNYYENPLRKSFPSYEETVEEALKYCLEHLIK